MELFFSSPDHQVMLPFLSLLFMPHGDMQIIPYGKLFSSLDSHMVQWLFRALLCYAVLIPSVMSDFLQPHGRQPIRLLCPWGVSRQDYWSGLPRLPPGDLPNPEIEPRSPALQADSLPSEPPGDVKEYCSEQPIPSPGELPDPGIEPGSPALQADSLLAKLPRKLSYHKLGGL